MFSFSEQVNHFIEDINLDDAESFPYPIHSDAFENETQYKSSYAENVVKDDGSVSIDDRVHGTN